ncbi:g1673 [Coccomyxa elongata]
MVRFHWHVETGLGAFAVGPQTVHDLDGTTQVFDIPTQIELAGQKDTFEGLITIRSDYLKAGQIQPVGIVLGHDTASETWKGKLLSQLAISLAKDGFVVMRNLSSSTAKDVRRYRLFEKALDALATSPYARSVYQWVLAGLGNGGRVAAVVASRCRGTIAGVVLLSYPLLEPLQPTKSSKAHKSDPSMQPTTSEAPLLKLQCPCLFVSAEGDQLCPTAALAETQQRMQTTSVQNVLIQGVDRSFAPLQQGGETADETVRQVCEAVLQFVRPLNTEALAAAPPAPPPSAEPMQIDDAGKEDGEQTTEQQPTFELESAVEQNLQDPCGPDQDAHNTVLPVYRCVCNQYQRQNVREEAEDEGPTSTGYLGVSFDADIQAYRATAYKGKRVLHLGYYKIPEDAAVAYDRAVIEEELQNH